MRDADVRHDRDVGSSDRAQDRDVPHVARAHLRDDHLGVRRRAPRSVTGRPTSLLNDSRLAWVRNLVASTAAVMSFVDVLPLAPVTATTFASMRDRSSRASIISASPVDRTDTAGPSTSSPSRTSTPAAPFANASGTNRPPSVRSPGSATNNAAGRDVTGVDRDGRHLDVLPEEQPLDRAGHVRHPARLHARLPRASSSSRATTRSSNGIDLVPELLDRLVALPGDDHHVARVRLVQRQPDRRAPVGLDHERAAPLLRTGLDLGDDRQRILRSRVVRGDHAEVGVRRGRRTHRGTLRAVAIPTATEHEDQATGRQRARRAQHASDAIRRVCVVHHHQEILTGLDRLHPAGNLPERRETPSDRVVVDAERACGRGGGQQVLHVERPTQPETGSRPRRS